MQDRLDGGISLLLRCPGSDCPANLTADKVTVDVYITPRELVRSERINGDTAILVQAFCEDFAIPHLKRFTECCKAESIRPPKPRCKSFSCYPADFTNIHNSTCGIHHLERAELSPCIHQSCPLSTSVHSAQL